MIIVVRVCLFLEVDGARRVRMKASLRFEHTPRPMEKIKRRRRRKMKSPEQPVVEVVNIEEKENPITSKWVGVV